MYFVAGADPFPRLGVAARRSEDSLGHQIADERIGARRAAHRSRSRQDNRCLHDATRSEIVEIEEEAARVFQLTQSDTAYDICRCCTAMSDSGSKLGPSTKGLLDFDHRCTQTRR